MDRRWGKLAEGNRLDWAVWHATRLVEMQGVTVPMSLDGHAPFDQVSPLDQLVRRVALHVYDGNMAAARLTAARGVRDVRDVGGIDVTAAGAARLSDRRPDPDQPPLITVPPVRPAAETGREAPGPAGAEHPADDPGAAVPGGPDRSAPSVLDIDSSVAVAFEERSKEVSGAERARIDTLVGLLAQQAARSVRAGLPLPRIAITGYGNGSRLPSPSQHKRAHDTGWRRAEATRRALEESLSDRLDSLRGSGDPALEVGDFDISLASAGRSSDPEGRDADVGQDERARARRRAVISVTYQSEPAPTGHQARPQADTAGEREPVDGGGAEQREVRLHSPNAAEAPDGTALRQTIAELLGDAPRHIAGADIAFSDENLREHFHRALDGGHTERLGDNLATDGPEITVRVLRIDGSPADAERVAHLGETGDGSATVGRAGADQVGVTVSEGSLRAERSTVAARGERGKGIEAALVTPFGVILARLVGIVNERQTAIAVSTSSEESTTVSEPPGLVSTGQHQVTYQVAVRWPSRAPLLRSARPDASSEVVVPVRANWQIRPAAPAAEVVPALRRNAIEHAEFVGLGAVYRAVESRIGGLRANDPAGGQLSRWLESLPSRADDLFAGRTVRGRFRFQGGRGETEILLAIADPADPARTATVVPDAVVEHSRKAVTEHEVRNTQTREWGGRLLLMPGNILAGAGPAGVHTRFTRDTSEVKSAVEHTVVSTYQGPLDKYRTDIRFLVRVEHPHGQAARTGAVPPGGTRVDGTGAATADVRGAATVWMRPPDAEPEPEPRAGSQPDTRADSAREPLSSGPLADAEREGGRSAEARRVLDRVGARYRFPDDAADRFVGPVVHRLASQGAIRAGDTSQVADDLRAFVRANARELVNGSDGVRFPLSSLRAGYPDVFLRGTVRMREAAYFGALSGQSITETLDSHHEHATGRSRGRDIRLGAASYVYSPPLFVNGEVFHTRPHERGERERRGFAAAQSFSGDLHRWRYEVDVTVSIGGQWGMPAPPARWPGETAAKAAEGTGEGDLGSAVLSTRVEVDAPATRGAALTAIAATLAPDPGTGRGPLAWSQDVPDPHVRKGRLPAEYRLEAVKPVPGMLATVSEMLADTAAGRWWSPVESPLLGSRRGDFDGPDGSLHALEAFTSVPVRMARFERTVAGNDSVMLQRPNRGGLLGSRLRAARVELSTVLGNPTVISRDDGHTFASDQRATRETRTDDKAGKGVNARVAPAVFKGVSPTVALALGATAEVSYARTAQEGSTAAETIETAATREYTGRGYLVMFDAAHKLSASVSRHWFDFTGMHHDSDPETVERWTSTRDAVAVWVPASEIHRVGVMDEFSVQRLAPQDAVRYSQARAGTRQDTATRPTAQQAGNGPGQDGRGLPETASNGAGAGPALPASLGTRRGRGTVELYDLGAARDFVRNVEQRLPAGGDLLRAAATGADGPRHESRLRDLQRLNERLVADVIGPVASAYRFGQALDDMLDGGWPVYLEGHTPFGKVEQLVVVHAELGPGKALDSVRGRTGNTHTSGSSGTVSKGRETRAALAVGGALFPGRQGVPAALLALAAQAVHVSSSTSEETTRHSRSVGSSTTADTVRFLHDLRIRLEIHPYARPGTYSRYPVRLLPGPGAGRGTGAAPTAWPRPGAPRRAGAVWTDTFELPGAVRRTVPAQDVVLSTGAEQRQPLSTAAGSLREAQEARGEPLGLTPETQLMVHPFAAQGLAARIADLVHTDAAAPSALGPQRPNVHPRTAYQLMSATRGRSLAAHLDRAMSKDGYAVPVEGAPLKEVRIAVDLHDRDLLAVLDGGLRTADTDAREVVSTSEATTTLVTEANAGLRGPHVGGAVSRSGATVTAVSAPLAERKREYTGTVTSASGPVRRPGGDAADDRRYLVRVTPRWRVTPVYRGSGSPQEWSSVLTADDEPFLVEVDRRGLEQFGLSAASDLVAVEDTAEREAVRPEAAVGHRAPPRGIRTERAPDAFDTAASLLLRGTYAGGGDGTREAAPARRPGGR